MSLFPRTMLSFIKPAYLAVRKPALKLVVHPGPQPDLPGGVRSLVVISEQRLGDICVAIPIFQSLRAAYPNAELAIVLPRNLQPLVQWACPVDTVFDPGETRRIISRSWDVAIDLTTDYMLAPARLAASTQASVRIGFENAGRGQFFNIALAAPENVHASDIYAKILEPLRIGLAPSTIPDDIPGFSASIEHRIAIHPGAHHETQRWPEEYYADLIRRIQEGGESCIVLGAPGERGIVDRIVQRAGGSARTGITSSVLELAAAVRNADILICNNSGPLHLAALLGRPTLSFMGPTLLPRWSPRGEGNVILRRDELPCIGCNLGYCRIGTHACMKEITPEYAYNAYRRMRSRLQDTLR